MENKIPKVKIDSLSFQELMLYVKKGDIRIPNFQREFVWELSQIISLLDSIYHHYPIGSFLFWRTGEEIEIIVADQGPGVPLAERERIFDHYYTTKPSGTGIGLSEVARMAAAMGGGVRVEDAEEGGARFRVHFRRAR